MLLFNRRRRRTSCGFTAVTCQHRLRLFCTQFDTLNDVSAMTELQRIFIQDARWPVDLKLNPITAADIGVK